MVKTFLISLVEGFDCSVIVSKENQEYSVHVCIENESYTEQFTTIEDAILWVMYRIEYTYEILNYENFIEEVLYAFPNVTKKDKQWLEEYVERQLKYAFTIKEKDSVRDIFKKIHNL